jgi:hypothetical protein
MGWVSRMLLLLVVVVDVVTGLVVGSKGEQLGGEGFL